MVKSTVDRRRLAFILTCYLVLVPRRAFGAPRDGAATRLANEALQDDYLSLRFGEAVKKLQRAITLCQPSACSADVLARLHRDLGVVLVAGLNRPADGTREFRE